MKLSELKALVADIEADMALHPTGNMDPHIIIDPDMRGVDPQDLGYYRPISMNRVDAPEYAAVPMVLGDYLIPLKPFRER